MHPLQILRMAISSPSVLKISQPGKFPVVNILKGFVEGEYLDEI